MRMMIMRIALCDDENSFLIQYDEFMDKLSSIVPKLEYDEILFGKSLLERYEIGNKPYDIIFLDIEMTDINGIEIAKRIRLFDENVIIVFVTNHTEYVYDSFEVGPFRFLVKPIEFNKFKEVFMVSYEKILKNKRIIFITSERKSIHLSCNEIYYIESQKRLLLVHTANEIYRNYGKLESWIEKLYQNDFIMMHKSYLVNLNHVSEFKSSSVKLINGDIIPISENKHKYVKEEHIKYMLRAYTHVE
jgi:two-component system response regulator LytT